MPKITNRTVAFSTPWFDVIAKEIDGNGAAPHYTVKPLDYVTVLATDEAGRILLVRQFRPVLEDYTLELPSGLIEPGEAPEVCARRELLEETGHEADQVDFLGTLAPDTGRLGNRMWVYAARHARPLHDAAIDGELELVTLSPAEFVTKLTGLSCDHALNFAAVLLAILKGQFAFPLA